MRLLAVALFVCACGSPPDAKTTPAAGGPPWSKLTIEWSYGPCDPNGTKSCNQLLRITSDGNATTEEAPPNPNNPKLTKSSNLSVDERASLDKILASTAFRKGMDDGFGCPESQDARIVITFESGSSKQQREVAQCMSSSRSSSSSNAARSLVDLLQTYRFAQP